MSHEANEKIALRVMVMSETEDSRAPYRILPPGDPKWIESKVFRVKAALNDVEARAIADRDQYWREILAKHGVVVA